MKWLAYKAWSWTYRLEDVRERAQAEDDLWAQAAACMGLAVLRRWGR